LIIFYDSFEKIKVKEIESSSIENKNAFVKLLNYRIDYKEIKFKKKLRTFLIIKYANLH
jgi:hypothetical protein